jgi:hypothetical protein
MNISIESKKLDFIGKQSPLETSSNYDSRREEIKEFNLRIDEYAEISINGVEMIPLDMIRKLIIEPCSWWADLDYGEEPIAEDFSIMLCLASDGDENNRECGVGGMLRETQYIDIANGGIKYTYRHLPIKDIFKLFIESYGDEHVNGETLKGKMMEVFDEAVKECEENNG